MKFKLSLLLLLLTVFTYSSNALAGLYFQHSAIYYSTEDSAEGFTYTMLRNNAVVGASFGGDGSVILGWNVMSWSKEHKGTSSSTASDIGLLELGPKFIWFLNDEKTVSISGTWNPYVKGERKTSEGDSEDVEGSSIQAGLSYQFKVTKKFYIGASINYHAVSISEATDSSNTVSTVSNSYTDIYPAFEFSFRFK